MKSSPFGHDRLSGGLFPVAHEMNRSGGTRRSGRADPPLPGPVLTEELRPDDRPRFELGEILARSLQQVAEDLPVVLTERGRRRAVESMRTRFESHRVARMDLLAGDRMGHGLEEPTGDQLFRRVDEAAVLS